jgi:hypothetical protein
MKPAEIEADPTCQEYYLKCRTRFITKNVSDEIKKGVVNQYQRHMVILVPEHNDQFVRFARAWVPETIEEYYELAADLGPPIHGPSRLSVHMGHDQWCDRPYLLVMSKGVEEIIQKFPEGCVMQVTTLSANEESQADHANDDTAHSFDVVN